MVRKERLCKNLKLSYMQMQEWVCTRVLMAIARILSPEQDSPYLGFCCHRRMEFLTKTLFSAIPSWWRVSFWSLSPPIPQILYEGFFVWHSWEHCSTFGLNANFSVCPLMLSSISPALTSMCAFAVLKNGLPKMRGVLASTSMSRTTKSMGMRKFHIFTGTFYTIPAG